jgi:hypothetical protein
MLRFPRGIFFACIGFFFYQAGLLFFEHPKGSIRLV